MSFRSFLLIASLAICMWLPGAARCAIPGVRITRDADRSLLPPGYDLILIDVDWTEPRLNARLLAPEKGLRWDDARTSIGAALLIQLSEPKPAADGRFVSSLPLYGPASATSQPRIEIAGLVPWLPCGGPVVPPWSSSLAGHASAIGVTWMDRSDQFEKFPELVFRDRCVISWTDPVRNRTVFALLARTAADEVRTADLKPWLKSRVAAGRWLALHATGEHALASSGGDLLGPAAAPRFIGRVGAALVLKAAAAGDPVDLARQPGATITASSFDRDFEPLQAVSGRLLPSPFAPSAWVSRPLRSGDDAPWFKLQLPQSSPPITEIRLFWASAAGWSSHYNPATCRLEIAEGDGAFETALTIKNPRAPYTLWKPSSPLPIRSIRLVFDDPSQMPVDPRARLAAIQLLAR